MTVYNVTSTAESFTCNAYLSAKGRVTLVDVGSMSGVTEVITDITETVEAVMITHQHRDHVAELAAVVDVFDPAVYAFDDHPLRTHPLEDGDSVAIGAESFDVIHTPGHATDHVAFVSESTIYSGDVVVANDGAFDYGSFGRTDRSGQSREDLIESIQRILERLPATVEHMYAGHGDEFHGDVRDVIETALSRAERREPKYPN